VIEQSGQYAAIAIGRLTKHGYWSVQNYKVGKVADVLNMFNRFYNHFIDTDQSCTVEHLDVGKLSSLNALANGPHFTN